MSNDLFRFLIQANIPAIIIAITFFIFWLREVINYRTSQESLFSSRLFLALIVSSLAALPPTLILLTLEGSVIRYFGWIGSGAIVLVFSLFGNFIFGLPIHFFMQRKGFHSNFSYLIAGFLLPILLLALIPVSHGDWHDLADTNNIDFMLVFAIAGAAVALTFRALMKIRRI